MIMASTLLALMVCSAGVHGKVINSVIMKIIADIWSNNQWKENAYVFKFSQPCRNFKENVPGFYEQLLRKREVKGACLFRPGVYEINDAPMNWTFPNIPIMPYRQYRVRIMVGKAENLHACWVVECRTIPRGLQLASAVYF
ncbi:uncharacterized protein LOC127750141 [Frankliniella occidentalis]|uniref:Uncharacterized protein LOC127750141 n=1 Tax=Frankliniella occidentalis TaxID=133901 RepID=A0A9C6X0U2_FRAOC|nr:uncharacterized protein LOC127750141 [Frankliniella occidentalis]